MMHFESKNLEKNFGGITALDGVNIALDEGELVGMIGPNGAGKTTFFNCITGFIEPDNGEVILKEDDVTGQPPYEMAKKGVIRTFQMTQELETLTVRENVMLPAMDHPGERIGPAIVQPPAVNSRESEVKERANELLDRFELADLADEYAANLSGGQGKLLELARAMILDPDILLLDEPFSGVNPNLTDDIISFIHEINNNGVTVFIIEHEIGTLTELVNRLIVLDEGSVLVKGEPETVLQDDRVAEAYLGT